MDPISLIRAITAQVDLHLRDRYSVSRLIEFMLDTIEKLLILQDRDRKLRRVRAELAHIGPERQMFQAKAADAQTALEEAKSRVKQLESERKTLELEVETKKQLIARYANQQLQTRKNEEYRALTHEIETCKAEIFKIEDKEIELMEQAEAAHAQMVQANQASSEAKKLVDGQIADLATREENLKKELVQLEADRDQLAAAV